MTKKDFELIAAVIQTLPTGHVTMLAHNGAKEAIASDFADALASVSPRFDRDRFLRACVPGANVKARGAK